MNCQEFEALIPDLLRNELEAAHRLEAEAHRSICSNCNAEMESLQTLWEGLGRAPAEPNPLDFERFRQAMATRHRMRPRLSNIVLPMAAGLLLALGGFATGKWFMVPRRTEARFPMLAQTRASDRMLGVMLMSQGQGVGDPASATALLDLVERDPESQVRMAALDALYLFGSQPEVMERLVKSLPRQTSPDVQAAQVDLLLALRERRALESLRNLLRDPRLAPESRRRLKNGLSRSL